MSGQSEGGSAGSWVFTFLLLLVITGGVFYYVLMEPAGSEQVNAAANTVGNAPFGIGTGLCRRWYSAPVRGA